MTKHDPFVTNVQGILFEVNLLKPTILLSLWNHMRSCHQVHTKHAEKNQFASNWIWITVESYFTQIELN